MATQKTTYTFAVTFEAPPKMPITIARALIIGALLAEKELELAPGGVKVSLTNKEVKYGKR